MPLWLCLVSLNTQSETAVIELSGSNYMGGVSWQMAALTNSGVQT